MKKPDKWADQHREMFPEQYEHPLCGKEVFVEGVQDPIRGVVERVVGSRFGPLAILEGSGGVAYQISQCKEIDDGGENKSRAASSTE